MPADVSRASCRFPPVDSALPSSWLSLGELASLTFCEFSLPSLLLKNAINDIIKTTKYTLFRNSRSRTNNVSWSR